MCIRDRSRTTSASSSRRGAEPGAPAHCSPFQEPFVHRGGGAPKGLHPLEHVQWARSVDHPMFGCGPELDGDLQAALSWVAENTPHVVDEFRRSGLRQFLALAGSLEREREEWVRRAPPQSRAL
eukprot:9466359-Pyramimonas_sp.AAC.1